MNSVVSFFSRFNYNYFFGLPAETFTTLYFLVFFVILILAILVYYILLRKKASKQKPYKVYAREFLWPNLAFDSLAILLILARYESIDIFSWRIWPALLVLVALVYNVWFFVRRRQQLEDELDKLSEKNRKEKWLKPVKK